MSGFSLVLSCLPANLLFEHWKFFSLQSAAAAAAAAAAAYDDKPRTLLLLAKQNVSNKYPSDKWSSLKVRGRSNAISFSSLCLESCWNKSCFFFLECFFQLNVNSKIFFIEILCLFFGGLHRDIMPRFYPFCANEAPSVVNTTLDCSTYPGWKLCYFGQVMFFV